MFFAGPLYTTLSCSHCTAEKPTKADSRQGVYCKPFTVQDVVVSTPLNTALYSS